MYLELTENLIYLFKRPISERYINKLLSLRGIIHRASVEKTKSFSIERKIKQARYISKAAKHDNMNAF